MGTLNVKAEVILKPFHIDNEPSCRCTISFDYIGSQHYSFRINAIEIDDTGCQYRDANQNDGDSNRCFGLSRKNCDHMSKSIYMRLGNVPAIKQQKRDQESKN